MTTTTDEAPHSRVLIDVAEYERLKQLEQENERLEIEIQTLRNFFRGVENLINIALLPEEVS